VSIQSRTEARRSEVGGDAFTGGCAPSSACGRAVASTSPEKRALLAHGGFAGRRLVDRTAGDRREQAVGASVSGAAPTAVQLSSIIGR
jgi:hypothetical protein